MLPLGTQIFFLCKSKNLKNTNNNSYYSKNKQKEMYTGAPEKCLEVFAFTKKKDAVKFPVQNSSSTPLAKKQKKT